MTDNVLREGDNEVTIEGILSENKLDYKTTAEGKDYISGDLWIETSESNIVPVNFFSFAVKKDGGPNRIYKNLENVVNNYKSIAKHGREGADRVRITGGTLESNEFYNAGGNLISTFRVRSNFINRVTGDFAPKADFAIEVYIQSSTEEVKDDTPTGRYLIKGIVPGYNGKIHLLTFFVENSKAIEYIKQNYSVGDTVKLAGRLANEMIEVNRTEEMEFGDDIITTFTRIKRELIVDKGSKPYEEAEKFPGDLIKQSMVERDVDLKTKQEKAMQQNTPAGAGFVTGEDVPF
jgi:hypothetical protein